MDFPLIPSAGGDCANSEAAFPPLIPTKPQKPKWTDIFRNFSFSTPHKRENCLTKRQLFSPYTLLRTANANRQGFISFVGISFRNNIQTVTKNAKLSGVCFPLYYLLREKMKIWQCFEKPFEIFLVRRKISPAFGRKKQETFS